MQKTTRNRIRVGNIALCFLYNLIFAQESMINIDVASQKAEIQPSMYGLFFEDINRAMDGGLYAEMILNRGFEENTLPSGCTYDPVRKVVCAPNKPVYSNPSVRRDFTIPWDIGNTHPGWSISTSGGTLYTSKIVDTNPLNPATTQSFYLDIQSCQQPVQLINSGFWGIALKREEKYLLTFYLLANPGYSGEVDAQLLDAGNQIINSHSFTVTNDGGWHKYECEFTAGRTLNNARFALQFNAAGIVQIDYVSLFPEKTFKNRKNGFRTDVAGMLADLKPAFLRWPGGCIVEGLTMENRVKWKNTIGSPETRKGEYNLWGYHSTNGFGYHEFLDFCEDLSCDGVFVCNAGMSCDGRNGDYYTETEVEELIQDALDALEYAMGDASTTWGAKRIANGRIKPFHLKYIEIGNENHSAIYAKYYNKFYDRIRSKYPDITIITCLPFSDQLNNLKAFDMIDPHFYNNPFWFYNNTHYFDTMPRENYKVYVGEYACIVGVGTGTMDAAMSEGAFMMGMERNSDLVTMASFAPLLENPNARSCEANLIRIKNDAVMGRSSYYVQKLFSENRPDVNLETQVQLAPLPREDEPFGMIGFATWDTQVEIKNVQVKVDGKVVYRSDFVNKPQEWESKKGNWKVENGVLVQKSLTPSIVLLSSQTFNSKNMQVEFEAVKKAGVEGFSLVFGAKDALNYYQMSYGTYGNQWLIFEKITNGGQMTMNDNNKPFIPIQPNVPYRARLNIKGDTWISYLNNVKRVEYSNAYLQKQYAIAGLDREKNEIVIKIINAEDTPMDVVLNIDHATLQSVGEITTLAASSRNDENSFGNPRKIYPVSYALTEVNNALKLSIKPCSVNIIRLKISGTQGIKNQKTSLVKISNVGQQITVMSLQENPITKIEVVDMTGRQLFSQQVARHFQATFQLSGNQQLVIVRVDTANGREIQKLRI